MSDPMQEIFPHLWTVIGYLHPRVLALCEALNEGPHRKLTFEVAKGVVAVQMLLEELQDDLTERQRVRAQGPQGWAALPEEIRGLLETGLPEEEEEPRGRA